MESTFSEQLMPPHLIAQKYHDIYYEHRLNELTLKEQKNNKLLIIGGGLLVITFVIYTVMENNRKKEMAKLT